MEIMSEEAIERAVLEYAREPHPSDQDDCHNRWCFGLAHPVIQRLIFLAGAMEESALTPDGSQDASST
jgi:hypothetical protein